MINSDKAYFKICGEYQDIVFELNHILEYFVKNNPEVLGGALAVWGDELKAALSKSGVCIELLDCTKEMTEHYTHLRKELENE